MQGKGGLWVNRRVIEHCYVIITSLLPDFYLITAYYFIFYFFMLTCYYIIMSVLVEKIGI